MKIRIPIIPEHNGFDGYVREITISDRCPVCGRPRGKPFKTFSYDGSRRVACDGWENPCGHIDKYENCVKEAQNLLTGANK